jgi:hypothetical protein
VTGSMYEGLGYTPNGVQSAATKPVSGEAIVTFLERMDAIAEHGTKKGYDDGCRGSHCPGKDAVGMSCSQASIRYAGDMGYRRRVDAGLTAEQIWVEDQSAHVVMPKVNVRDPRGTVAFEGEQLTVEDSVAVYEADEDFEAEEAGESVPQQQAESVPVGGGERPAAAPVGKWAIRKEWAAVSPAGELCGPFLSFDKALAFVGEQMPKPRPRSAETQKRRRITDEDRATFRQLHSEGLSTGKIARQTGRALSVVARELGLMGLASNGHQFGAKRA